MKKIVFYIPAIIFIVIYSLLAISSIGAISHFVAVWLVLFLTSGILLSRDMFWGGSLGILPAIHLIYMGTQETGQIINEISIGIIVFVFYVVWAALFFIRTRKQMICNCFKLIL